jgi:hypothetical protein
MPKLIKNITVDYQEGIIDEVSLTNNISTTYQDGDYQKVFGHIAFIQDYSQVDNTEDLPTPANFGLAVNKNKTF